MTHIPEEQLISEPTIEKAVIKKSEVHFPHHEILGQTYEFHGASFTVLGLQPEFFEEQKSWIGLPINTLSVINMESENVPVITFEGGMAYITKIRIDDKVVTDCTVISERIVIIERVPEGWMTNNLLTVELGADFERIQSFSNIYAESHPEWFHKYKDARNRILLHYSPELCALIRKRFSEEIKAPEGWMTKRAITLKLGIDGRTYINFVEPYRESHPEWFHMYKSKTHFTEHYAPELCDLIRIEYSKTPKAPEGWMTKSAIAKDLNISQYSLVFKSVDKYRSTNPEWFHDYRPTTGVISEHYSPELSKIIIEEILQINKSPEGWKTNGGLTRDLRVTFHAIRFEEIVVLGNAYRITHPEWFQLYKPKTGRIREHYSPELCDLIRQEVKNKRS